MERLKNFWSAIVAITGNTAPAIVAAVLLALVVISIIALIF